MRNGFVKMSSFAIRPAHVLALSLKPFQLDCELQKMVCIMKYRLSLLLLGRRRTLKSTSHSVIFWEMVKFVDLGVLSFSLVLPRQPLWVARGPEWILRSLGGLSFRLAKLANRGRALRATSEREDRIERRTTIDGIVGFLAEHLCQPQL